MCNEAEHGSDEASVSRRNFLRIGGAAAALGASGTFFMESARADALTHEQRDKMTPEQIIEEMREGNERFQRGETKPRSYLREQKASAKGQYPAAVLLTCID
jgi:carbonic anhydrase